jgi:signal transduction histidine kinase/ActR/RegA family two-component response regulator
MSSFVEWLFPSNFMPHGHCYLWRPDVLWLHVGSDSLIATSYFAIPVALTYFVRKRKAVLPYWWLPVLFAAFIMLCGSTHLMSIWTVWNPDYVLDGYIKLATALASAATAVMVYRVLPAGMALRTPVELQREVDARTMELSAINAQLRAEIAERERVETQLRQSEHELRESLQKLAEADTRKDEFLAILSHELRNPLAPILTSVHLLQRKGGSDPVALGAQQIIDRQVRHMSRLLDDLLDVSRLSKGIVNLQREYFDLRVALELAIETARPHLDKDKHAIEIRSIDEPLIVHADQNRLVQIFTNLINNACKYSPSGTAIEIEADGQDSAAVIRIIDHGAGIAPELTERIFEMFAQADTSLERPNGGLGIGLTLARELARLHGGEITVSSRGLGQGSTFTVQLPLAREHGNHAVALQPTAMDETKDLTVLVCDDNVDAAQSMAMMLETFGHRVITAHDGLEAWSILEARAVDVAILDIGMPGLSGYELAKRLRSAGRSILLIALTGWGQEEDKARAHAAGFDAHLTKPAEPASLMKLIAPYSGKQRRALEN